MIYERWSASAALTSEAVSVAMVLLPSPSPPSGLHGAFITLLKSTVNVLASHGTRLFGSPGYDEERFGLAMCIDRFFFLFPKTGRPSFPGPNETGS